MEKFFKVYKCPVILGFPVNTLEGGKVKVVFEQIAMDGSYYRCEDPVLAASMELHPLYGKRFFDHMESEGASEVIKAVIDGFKEWKRVNGDTGVKAVAKAAADAAATGAGNVQGQPKTAAGGEVTEAVVTETGDQVEPNVAQGDGKAAGNEEPGAAPAEVAGELEAIEFGCFEDAREWAHETFGVPKKKLMSIKSVVENGKANGYAVTIN